MSSYDEIAHAADDTLHSIERVGGEVLKYLKEFLDKVNPLTLPGDVLTFLREILHGLGDLFGGELHRLLELMHEPQPDPAKVRDLASAFTNYATEVGHHDEDLSQAKGSLTEQVWDDVDSKDKPAEAARGSLNSLATRSATIGPAGRGVATALDDFADQMTTARKDYHTARDEFDSVGSVDKIVGNAPLWPWDWPGYLGGVFHKLEHAVQGMLAAHKLARDAGLAAQDAIRKAERNVQFPDHISPNLDVFASISQSSTNGSGPLREGVEERADQMIAQMSAADQAQVKELLANARSDKERAWILGAAAAGNNAATLTNFANHLKQMTPEQIDQLDPQKYSDKNPGDITRTPDHKDLTTQTLKTAPFIQPDDTTCGSSSLVMAKMMNDPVYAMQIMTGYDAKTGAQDNRQGITPSPPTRGTYAKGTDGRDNGGYTDTVERTPAMQRFAEAAQQMHDATTGAFDQDGNPQFPWPKALGTAPWGAAHEMGAQDGAGIPGHGYDWHAVNQYNQDEQFQAVAAAVQHGEVLPLYVGGSGSPHHVVLVTGFDANGNLNVYEPGSGRTTTVSREQFTGAQPLDTSVFGTEADPGRVWGTVVPTS